MRSWLVIRLFALASWLLSIVPTRALHAAGHAAGVGLALIQPRRRALVRSNLARVCDWLAAHDLASPRVLKASRNPRALDRLVLDAYGHYVRGYLEALVLGRASTDWLRDAMTLDDPALVAEAIGRDDESRAGRLFITMHFGSIELPAAWTVRVGGLPVTAPMETLADPALQHAIAGIRNAAGVRIIPLEAAATELTSALDRGEGVALVADRLIRGGGVPVELFGAPTRLPLGPAALALEHDVPVYITAVRRTGYGTYAGHISRLELPSAELGRRARLRALVEAQARQFEQAIAVAPEQWWTIFFPIWGEADRR